MIYYNWFEKYHFSLSMLKVTKCQAIQLKVIELQTFTQNVISQRDTAKNRKHTKTIHVKVMREMYS